MTDTPTQEFPAHAALRKMVAVETENVRFAQELADSFQNFNDGLRAVAAEADDAQAVSHLLLQISQVSLAGARLGAHQDFSPLDDYQPDVGPDADVDDLRMRLAALLGDLDTYSYVIDPYEPDVVESQVSDDLASIAADLENGLRHHRKGDVDEALWWWQFSYVSSWGVLAGAVLNALVAVVAHDRLDVDVPGERDQIDAAAAVLDARPDNP